MGQQVGGGPRNPPSGSTDPRGNPYLQPLYPQLYPPLGHADDGTPLFVPGQQTRTEKAAAESAAFAAGPAVAPSDENGGPSEPERRPARPALRGPLALVALAVVVVLGAALMLSMRNNADPDTTTLPTYTPTITALPTQPTIPRVPGQTEPDDPLVPGQGAPPSDSVPSAGKAIVYEVALSDSGSIIYVDDTGLRTAVGSPTKWSITFTGVDNPLRILVISAVGSASCQIKVDGKVVAADSITGDSSRRTLSCRA